MSQRYQDRSTRFSPWVLERIDTMFGGAPPEDVLFRVQQADRPMTEVFAADAPAGIVATTWQLRDRIRIEFARHLAGSPIAAHIDHVLVHEAVVRALQWGRLLGSFHAYEGDTLPLDQIDGSAANILLWLRAEGVDTVAVEPLDVSHLLPVTLPPSLLYDANHHRVTRSWPPNPEPLAGSLKNTAPVPGFPEHVHQAERRLRGLIARFDSREYARLQLKDRPSSILARTGYPFGYAKSCMRRRDRLQQWFDGHIAAMTTEQKGHYLLAHEAWVHAIEYERFLGSFYDPATRYVPTHMFDEIAEDLIAWLRYRGVGFQIVPPLAEKDLPRQEPPPPPPPAPEPSRFEHSRPAGTCKLCQGEGCDYCHGIGLLPREVCPECDGRGCDVCDDGGVQVVTCAYCNGEGGRCERCAGEGRAYVEIGYVCPRCEGERNVSDGATACQVCDTASNLYSFGQRPAVDGFIPVTLIREYEQLIPCPYCEEHEYFGCPNCDDKGFIADLATFEVTWERCPLCSEFGAGRTASEPSKHCGYCRSIHPDDWLHGDAHFLGCPWCSGGWICKEGYAEEAAEIFYEYGCEKGCDNPLRLIFEDDRPYILRTHYGIDKGRDLRRVIPKQPTIDSFHLADLTGCNLAGLDLSNYCFLFTNMTNTNCRDVRFDGAHTFYARFTGADLTGSTIEQSLDLTECDLRGAIGLTAEQKRICRERGALVDD